MPLQQTSGAASYDAFGGGVAAVPNYIEDVFGTQVYTGDGATRLINNGIDLAGKGGLVWSKQRNGANGHVLYDTARGAYPTGSYLGSDSTGAQNITFGQQYANISAFNSNGYTITPATVFDVLNSSGNTFVSWTLRRQPKFFDVVTWTGDASGNRTLSHTLASTPGCIIIKATNAVDDWYVYHTSLGVNKWLYLNTTSAEQTGSIVTAVSPTTFTVSQSNGFNTNGRTYVAYLFAHNAGGFGLTGTDNVISCGSFTTDSIGIASVTLGYEPQWLMVRRSDGVNNWTMKDVLRGSLTATVSGISAANLRANTADAESTNSNVNGFSATATGFYSNGNETTGSATYIYIAIRRGPMKVPTTGASVFAPVTYTGNNAARSLTSGFPVDLEIVPIRDGGQTWSPAWLNRLAGNGRYLVSSSTAAEDNWSSFLTNEFQSNTGVNRSGIYLNSSGQNLESLMFRRAPSVFDVVCYTGTGTNRTVAHNLTVVPELIILKSRSIAALWPVWVNGFTGSQYLQLNANSGVISDAPVVNFANINSASFDIQSAWPSTNQAGVTYVAYLFASAPGVSKVGSFTGTGATQVINCGFTGGARFVLIKSTSTSGDWYVWDSARGIVAGNDPYLALNSTAAEVTNTDWVDTAASGFELSNAGGNLANSNGVSYIFWAVA